MHEAMNPSPRDFDNKLLAGMADSENAFSDKRPIYDRLRSRRKTSLVIERREYRIVSTGEDGMLCFWNFDSTEFGSLSEKALSYKIDPK